MGDVNMNHTIACDMTGDVTMGETTGGDCCCLSSCDWETWVTRHDMGDIHAYARAHCSKHVSLRRIIKLLQILQSGNVLGK